MKIFTTWFIFIACIFFFTITLYTQGLRFGIEGGLTSITGPTSYTTSVADNGEGFGANYNYGAQLRLDIPLVPLTPIFFVDYHMLKGNGSSGSFTTNTSQNILSIGVEAEYILLPLPIIKPYASIEGAINNIGDLKMDYTGGSTSQGKMTRLGAAIGIGAIVTILPIFDLDVSLKYHDFNLTGSEPSIDAFSLNVALIL